MPATATLVDDFDDGTVNGELWPGNYGVYSEVGGRARIQCDPDYGAYVSASAYTLAGSSVSVRIYPPAAGGATTSAYAQLLLPHSVDGTNVSAKVDRVTGKLRLASNVDYFDGSAVEATYDPVAHAYVRISEASGTLTWSTSPDGSTWTTRRTAATPAWVTASTTISVQLETRRNNGTVDYAEFDDLNTVPVVTPPAGNTRQAAFFALF
ncbi:hypothetical protein [Streptomyces sp. NPDC048392]|uniref:hypothetical protein n=1 Tax=Streptomyces sp. NPDC048392 TaxID=3365543 RepID=UPI003712BD32